MFFTCFYGILELDTGRLEYSRAAHNIPNVVRADRAGHPTAIHELSGAEGLPLALFDFAEFNTATVQLEPGDSIFVFTKQEGADWIRGSQLAGYLNRRAIPGVRIYATRFTPQSSYFAKQTIEGVRFVITDREAFDSTRLGREICVALNTLYPGKIDFPTRLKLIGSKQTIAAVQALEDPKSIQRSWEPALERWSALRQEFLLYP